MLHAELRSVHGDVSA